ncbi:galactosylgalactosylxylosylprotein 3-beta-glucuronosyltransferase 3-like [Oculina patagonica]
MNRIRCTKLLLLIVFVSLFAYLMLKDEPMCTSVAASHGRITSREIGSMLFEDSGNDTEEPLKKTKETKTQNNFESRKELQRMKEKQQKLLKYLIKAKKTEEELKRNLIQLSRDLRTNKQINNKLQRSNAREDFNLPTVFVITPTFKRFVQKAELTRVSQALKPVENLHWIVVEDSINKTDLVANFLRNSGLKFTHLNVRTPDMLRRHRNEIRRLKPRGVVQRNLGIQWLRENIDPHRTTGVVYFADDDNTYDSRIFDEMRWIQGVGVWPVAFTGAVRWAGPVCKNGQVVGFHAKWGLFRPFPIDMAAFAVNINKLLVEFPKAKFLAPKKAGMLESSLLSQITTRKELEPVTPNCSKVYVWHTRTETPKDSIVGERQLTKEGRPSDKSIET